MRITPISIFLVLMFLGSDIFAFQSPKNDLKSKAQILDLGVNGNYFSLQGEYTFKDATGEEMRLPGWGDKATRSIWFKFIAPLSDQVIITLDKSKANSADGYIQMGILEGENPIASNAIGYPGASAQLITSNLIAGKTYYLIVDNPTEGELIESFNLKIQTFLIASCASVQTVFLGANGVGSVDQTALFKNECYWPCTGIGCKRELSHTKFDATHLGDNYVTVEGLASNGKAYFGTMLVKVVDTIPPTIIAKDFNVNITKDGKVYVDPMNVIIWRCRKTASEPSPNPTPDTGEDWFFQEIPCSKDNIGIERFELSKTIFTCEDLGVNEVIATVIDASGNKASTKVKITVNDLTPLEIKAKPVELTLDKDGIARLNPEILDNGSSSGCSGFESSASKTIFDYNDLGENKLSYIIKNSRGDMLAQDVIINIKDTIPPTIFTQNVEMFANIKGVLTIANGNAFVKLCEDAKIRPMSNLNGLTPDGSYSENFFESIIEREGCTKDNGQIFEIWTEPREFTIADLGVNVIDVFVSDMAGNIASAKTKLTLIKPELPCKQQLWAIASGDWNDPNIWSDKPEGKSIGAIPCNNTIANIKGFSVMLQTDEIIQVESIRLLSANQGESELNIYAGQLLLKKEMLKEKNVKVYQYNEEALKVIKN